MAAQCRELVSQGQKALADRDLVLDPAECRPGQNPLRHEFINGPVRALLDDGFSEPATKAVQLIG